MTLTKKEASRYRTIIRQLSRLSLNGWDKATHPDYEILESELAQLATKLTDNKGAQK